MSELYGNGINRMSDEGSALGKIITGGRDGLDAFITDLLISIGCDYLRVYGIALIDVIKLLVLHPEADFNAFQKKHVRCGELETSYGSIIKRSFDINNIPLYENIENVTCSKVYSPTEAVYNLAGHVRMEYCLGKERGNGGIGA